MGLKPVNIDSFVMWSWTLWEGQMELFRPFSSPPPPLSARFSAVSPGIQDRRGVKHGPKTRSKMLFSKVTADPLGGSHGHCGRVLTSRMPTAGTGYRKLDTKYRVPAPGQTPNEASYFKQPSPKKNLVWVKRLASVFWQQQQSNSNSNSNSKQAGRPQFTISGMPVRGDGGLR